MIQEDRKFFSVPEFIAKKYQTKQEEYLRKHLISSNRSISLWKAEVWKEGGDQGLLLDEKQQHPKLEPSEEIWTKKALERKAKANEILEQNNNVILNRFPLKREEKIEESILKSNSDRSPIKVSGNFEEFGSKSEKSPPFKGHQSNLSDQFPNEVAKMGCFQSWDNPNLSLSVNVPPSNLPRCSTPIAGAFKTQENC